jgi:hypothetical protein
MDSRQASSKKHEMVSQDWLLCPWAGKDIGNLSPHYKET